MTDVDIQLIERELGITLPETYRRAVMPFRIPALVGNTDTELWDDAHALIRLNLELRAGSEFRPAWPAHLFALGEPRRNELMALDTRSAEGAVWWLDRGIVVAKESHLSHPRFADWVEEFSRDQRSEMTRDGFNPDGTPQELAAAQSAKAKRSGRGCLIFIGALFVLVALGIVLPAIKAWRESANVLPPEALRALTADPQLVIYSLDPYSLGERPVDTNYYHGYHVLGTVTVTNASQRAELVAIVERGLAKWDRRRTKCGIMPRHALRASDRQQVYELLICFQCGIIDFYQGGKLISTRHFDYGNDPGLYNTILEVAGVPLGPMEPSVRERQKLE